MWESWNNIHKFKMAKHRSPTKAARVSFHNQVSAPNIIRKRKGRSLGLVAQRAVNANFAVSNQAGPPPQEAKLGSSGTLTTQVVKRG